MPLRMRLTFGKLPPMIPAAVSGNDPGAPHFLLGGKSTMSLVPGFSAHFRPEGIASSHRSRRRKIVKSKAIATKAQPARTDSRTLVVYGASLSSGLAFSVAWLITETIASAVLGWLAAALLIYSVRARRAYRPAYCCGLVVYFVGFYWIYGTVARFGGYGLVVSGVIFALYVASGALFFLVFAWTHHNLGSTFDAFALRSPTAIVVAELVTIRLFYWHFGHTQVAFTPFVQIAGIGGAMLVSFVMFWVAEAGVRLLVFREWRPAFLLPAASFAIALVYGAAMMHTLGSPAGEKQEVLLVQGPPSLAEKRDIDSIWQNLARIYDLSRESSRAGSLIVWPEGTIPAYIPRRPGFGAAGALAAMVARRIGVPRRGLRFRQRQQAIQHRVRRLSRRFGTVTLLQADPDPVRGIHAVLVRIPLAQQPQ